MKKITILGTGCPKCTQLAENAEQAAKALGIEYALEKVTDINEIMKFGIMVTPGIVVDGHVMACGRLAGVEEITDWLKGVDP